MKSFILTIILLVIVNCVFTQINSKDYVFSKDGKGLNYVQKDSLYSIKFQFRIQNRMSYLSKSETNFTPEELDFTVRRLRMKFKGFVLNPKFSYYIQLAFSRSDMNWESTDYSEINTSPNILRDAMFYYSPTKSLQFGIGQTKLPGNRQRVISSGNQQFTERSNVNGTYNLDRDFGLFVSYKQDYFNIQGAITSGEGRNARKSDYGLSYTGRIEYLPLGKFTNGNDYSEGDLAREQKPKFSIGASYNFNQNAKRTNGQIGPDLYAPINLHSYIVDYVFKYKGFAYYQEIIYRDSKSPITVNEQNDIRYAYIGNGMLSQVSYLFKNNYEICARYSLVKPNEKIYNNNFFPSLNEKERQQVQLGVTKYLYGHHLKIQGNILSEISRDINKDKLTQKFGAILQIEIGI